MLVKGIWMCLEKNNKSLQELHKRMRELQVSMNNALSDHIFVTI